MKNKHLTTLEPEPADTISQQEAEALAALADLLVDGPSLSRKDKRTILSTILPRSYYVKRYVAALATALSILAVMLLTPAVASSQPDDGALYTIKQGAQKVRSIVQPTYQSDDSDSRNDDSDKDKDDSPETDSRGRGSDDTRQNSQDVDHELTDKSGHGNDSVEQQKPDHNSVRDDCRDLLDQRKDAGEAIDSDAYKVCD